MPEPAVVQTEHQIKVDAPASAVYDLVADIAAWSRIFPAFVHLEHLGTSASADRIGMWSTSNDEVYHWVALWTAHPNELRIDFQPEVAPPPMTHLHRTLIVEPLSGNDSLVRLLHTCRLAEADQAVRDSIRQTTDEVGNAELAALKVAAERPAELLMTFGDAVPINGSAQDVYDFLRDAQQWPERLSHVSRVSLREETENLQVLEMDTTERDGGTLTTKMARVCLPHRGIVFKHLLLPPLGASHTVRWLIEESAEGVTLRSEHTVVIDETGMATMLGGAAGLAKANEFIHNELTTKTRLIFDQAKAFVEG
nr:SRPBCC family protein [Kibdelosporangium sp. MJ126-NF4]